MNNQEYTTIQSGSQQSEGKKLERELFNPNLTLGYFALQSHDTYQKSVHEIRGSLVGVERAKTGMLNRYLNGLISSDINAMIASKEKEFGRVILCHDWAANYASDDELLLLLSEHGQLLEEHATDEGIHAAIDKTLGIFSSAADAMVSIGDIPIEPKPAADVAISYGDIFDTHLRDRSGYYDSREHHIVLGQGYQTARESFVAEARDEMARVLTHEFVHGLLGTVMDDITSPMATRWVNEAITEALSKWIRKHDGELVIEDRVYEEEGLLLSAVASPLKDLRTTRKMLLRAYAGTDDDRALFVESVDRAWGTDDVLNKIQTAIELEQNTIAQGGAVTAAIEHAAVKKVRQTFGQNPDRVLRRGVEQHVQDMLAAMYHLK